MATKYYGINDKWTDDDIENVIEVTSEDGSVDSVKVNGVEYGGGGGGSEAEQLLITSATIEAGDTTTSAVKLDSITISDFTLDENEYVLFAIFRDDDPINAAYYGTSGIIVPSPSSPSTPGCTAYRYYNYKLTYYGGSYGIYPDQVYYYASQNKLTFDLMKRYSSTFTPNWSGDYLIKIYKMALDNVIAPSVDITPSE